MRRSFVAGNWKMNLTWAKIQPTLRELAQRLQSLPFTIDVAICPPSIYLKQMIEMLSELQTYIAIGAQNMHKEAFGAFTGEISGEMLADIGCQYVILGHSERRTIFGETDEFVAQKAVAAFRYGLLPIVCVGENLEQREKGETEQVITLQIERSLALLKPAQIESTTIAYEPIWAIGTGRAATPEIAQETHLALRKFLEKRYGRYVAETVRLQYGGSVKPSNMAELIHQPDIDGVLVGGASLQAQSFGEIIRIASELQN